MQGDDAIRVLSADGLEVVIDLTVLYKIMPDKAPAIYKGIGPDYKDKIVRPITRTGFVTMRFIMMLLHFILNDVTNFKAEFTRLLTRISKVVG